MADNDPFEKYAAHPSQEVTEAPSAMLPSEGDSDPFEKYAAHQPVAPVSSVATPSEPGPVSGQPAGPEQVPSHIYQDSSQPWYKRAWDWANTPLSESVFGLPEERQGAGGFERAAEHIASGFTSPLSLALTAATFGTGGLVESAGANALRESGLFSAEEIPEMVKAAQTALQTAKESPSIEPVIQKALEEGGHSLDLLNDAKKATNFLVPDTKFGEPAVQSVLEKAGFSDTEREALAKASDAVSEAKANFTPVDDALRQAGIDPAKWAQAQDILYKNGMTEHDLIGRGLFQNSAYQIVRKAVPTLPVAGAVRAAKTANSLLNAGFTLQQLEMGTQMSPRFLDALKEGNYDKAAEYGTEMAAGFGFGALGATHALHSAGELFKPLIETEKFRPNDEWLAIDRANKEREVQHAVAEQHAINIDREARRILGHDHPGMFGESAEDTARKADDLAETFIAAENMDSPERAGATARALRRARGEDVEIEPALGTEIPQTQLPLRSYTEVVHSNPAGEVRVGADGRPVVWLGPEAWNEFTRGANPKDPTAKFHGISLGPSDAMKAEDILSDAPDVQNLIKTARGISQQGLLTASAMENPSPIRIVSEELHHTWQRELSKDGELEDMLHPSQWGQLNGIIPEGWNRLMDEMGYDKDPKLRVLETAAQLMADRQQDFPGYISDDEANKFIADFLKEIEATHGPDAIKALENINEIAKQHVEDINAAREAKPAEAGRVAGQNPSPEVLRGVEEGRGAGNREGEAGTEGEPPEPRKLEARELEEEPKSFVSPNVHQIGSVEDAQFRLESRPQKLTEKLSDDLANELGARAVVRPAIGHWEGGAENSSVSRFPAGTDPELVEYYNTLLSKAGYQNAGGGFIPGEGTDVLFQFRVPNSVADATEIGAMLEAHQIPGDTIEPVPGGNLVHIVSENGDLRPQVAEAAARLGAEQVGEIHGKQFFNGDYKNRDAAQTVFDSKLRAIEARHPEWRQIREAFESRPDYMELSRLTRTTPEPFQYAIHGTSAAGLTSVSPEKWGSGPQPGAERARAVHFPDDFVKRSYWRVPGTSMEPFYERQPYQYRARLNAENLYNYVEDPEHLKAAAVAEATRRGIANQQGAIGTIYERMMKDAGYDGYYHPGGEIATFGDTPVEQELRAETSPLLQPAATPRGLFSLEAPKDWDYVKKYLTPEEQAKHNTDEKRNSFVTAFNALPDAEEWSAAVRAGRAGQMWYERSSRAFDALLDAGGERLKPADKEKFLNFVAALSPVQPVRQNLIMALDLWNKWDKAGRPEDGKWIQRWERNKKGEMTKIYGYNKSSKIYQTVGKGVDLKSRLNNAIRALQGEPMSGPKVSSFTKNLGEDVNRVTNDTWMAVLAGQDPNRINTPSIYHAMSAKVREAADSEGIDPRQAQAAAWSFIKSLAELSGWGKNRWIPPQEIIKQGLLTPELVASHSSDFADFIQNDPQIRELIKKLGGNLDAIDENFRQRVPAKLAQGEAPELSDRLINAADRLESARTNAEIQRHLEAKSGPQSSFNFERDTDFSPAYMDQATGGGGVIGGKYMPLYARERVPNPDVKAVAENYNKENGIDKFPHEGLSPVNADLAERVADAYDQMRHDPTNPQVRAAYDALIRETKAQWDAAKKSGYRLEPWNKEGQPYNSSEEMAKDVRDNKHLYYFSGGEIPSDHPLAQVDPETGEKYNNIFRAVHDLFGHAKNDYEFGPRGEENAFLAHSRMYSDAAVPALMSETKGQNSWVNFGRHLRDENGDIPGRNQPGYVPPADRPYAEQKAGLLPRNLIRESLRDTVLKQGQPLFAKGRPENGLPSNIDDLLLNNKFKNMPKEYQDRVIRAYERVGQGVSEERIKRAAKYLRDEQNKNFEIGFANDLLHHYLEDYMSHVWKDTNPEGRVILSNAKQGQFATNVNAARQRVFESTLTGLLRSNKQLELDPAKVTAQLRAGLIKAAANRNLIDTLRDNFTRASDGQPAVVLSGQGQVVTGENGEDPKTFIDPNRVRKSTVSDSVIQHLQKTGDFQRFLDEGVLKDITPYVTPRNIGAAIDRLEQQAQSKGAEYDAVGNNKLRTQLMYLKSMLNNGDYSGLGEFNDALEKKYAWDPQDYIKLDNGAMKGWNFVTNDSAGNSILVRSDIKVHPEFAQYLKDRLGIEPSGISKHPIGKALLGVGSKMKHTLLSLSPFHMVQIGLRGLMVGVNPFHLNGPDILSGARIDPMDPTSPTKLYKMIEQGMTAGTDYRALQEHSEGVSAGGGALRALPVVGKPLANALDWYQDFLFRRYIPAIKSLSAEHMFDEYQRLHPDWSTDRIARVAGAHANEAFGGINWRAMGRSVTTQDWGRLLLLAPDWLESELRSGARLFNKDEGDLGRLQVAKMSMALWGISRVLNLLTTGNAHYEAPFGLAVKNKEGKETIFSIRTLPTDLLHLADDPGGFLKGRLSPSIRAGQELLTQRDYFGRKLSPQDMWVDIFRNMAPIPVQSIGQMVTGGGPEVGNVGQFVKAIGGTAQVYRTPAEQLAAQLAANHNEDGPIDRVQMARHRRVMQFEDQLRSGEITWPDLVQLTYGTDQLTEPELKKIEQNYKKTRDLSPEMASLYTRASRLPAAEYLQLWDTMNPREKAALASLTLRVEKRYLLKAKKEMTPEERQRDPVFQRFMRMIPGATPAQPQQ